MRDDITGAEIAVRMKEAARTLRRLPPVRGPMGHRSHWPEWIRDPWDKYATEAALRDLTLKSRILPSPDEIDRMDEAVPWLQLLPQDEARLVWARANRRTLFELGKMMGVSESTARRRLMEIYLRLAVLINDEEQNDRRAIRVGA